LLGLDNAGSECRISAPGELVAGTGMAVGARQLSASIERATKPPVCVLLLFIVGKSFLLNRALQYWIC
jgi:hypothetical protein